MPSGCQFREKHVSGVLVCDAAASKAHDLASPMSRIVQTAKEQVGVISRPLPELAAASAIPCEFGRRETINEAYLQPSRVIGLGHSRCQEKGRRCGRP